MMLARYLKTRPIRYAMPPQDPQMQAALRNFLALNTRAYDLPHMAHLAQPHLGQVGGGRDQQLLQSLLHGTLHEHDPVALAQFLDVHGDLSGRPAPGHDDMIGLDESDPHGTLLDFLHMLHHSGQAGARGEFPLRERYGDPQQHAALVRQMLATHAPQLIGGVEDYATRPGLDRIVGSHASRAHTGNPAVYPPLYDALLHASTAPQFQHAGVTHSWGRRLRGGLAQALRQVIVPTVEGREPTTQPPF